MFGKIDAGFLTLQFICNYQYFMVDYNKQEGNKYVVKMSRIQKYLRLK